MKITNKRGTVLTVLVLKEEYEKLAVLSPTEPEIVYTHVTSIIE